MGQITVALAPETKLLPPFLTAIPLQDTVLIKVLVWKRSIFELLIVPKQIGSSTWDFF